MENDINNFAAINSMWLALNNSKAKNTPPPITKDNKLDNDALFSQNINIQQCDIDFDWDKEVYNVVNYGGIFIQRNQAEIDLNTIIGVLKECWSFDVTEINIIGNKVAITSLYKTMFDKVDTKVFMGVPLRFLIKDSEQNDKISIITGDYIVNSSLFFHTKENGFIAYSVLTA